MGRLLAVLATVMLLWLAGASVGATAGATDPCTRARIGTQIQCLRVGARCRPRLEHVYLLYDFTCKQDRRGRHRLHERIYIGPAHP